MNKKLILIGGVVILFAIVVAISIPKSSTQDVPTVFPVAENYDIHSTVVDVWSGNDEEGVVKISQPNGEVFRTRDFLKDADTYELSDDGIYSISASKRQGNIGDSYIIYYDEFDGSVIVSLRSTPLYTARLAAEVSLMNDTGLKEQDLCLANIMVNTPREVSEEYSGQNLGLSFCPGSVSL